MSDIRFHNQLGDEYELFKLASPHFEELENEVGVVIKEHFSSSDSSEIKILELGFGAGDTSLIILNADPRVELITIDNEPLMLPKASLKIAEAGNKNVEFLVEDALTFLEKCSEETFDVVASAFVIHNFTREYRSKVLKEIYRILKKGGLLINADKVEVTDRNQHAENMAWQMKQFDVFEKIGKPELKKEWTEHYLEDTKPGRALIENEFEEEIRSIGLNSFQILKRWYNDAVVLTFK